MGQIERCVGAGLMTGRLRVYGHYRVTPSDRGALLHKSLTHKHMHLHVRTHPTNRHTHTYAHAHATSHMYAHPHTHIHTYTYTHNCGYAFVDGYILYVHGYITMA